MPKLKTKSGAKKRFRLTASGKVKIPVSRKRHNMRKRGNRFLRQATGTVIAADGDARNIKRYFLPNA